MLEKKIQVGIILGSKSDESKIGKCTDLFREMNVPFEVLVLSAHRTPNKLVRYAETAQARGLKVLIAAAGLSAALPGALAAHASLPVIGVPLAAGALNGVDALYAITQMPAGVPVAAVGIDNAQNAALLAVRILALEDAALQQKLLEFRQEFGDIPSH